MNIIGDLEFVGFDGIGFVDLGGVFLHSHAWGKVPDQFLLYDIKIIQNPEANGAMRLPNLTGFSKEGIGAGKYKPRYVDRDLLYSIDRSWLLYLPHRNGILNGHAFFLLPVSPIVKNDRLCPAVRAVEKAEDDPAGFDGVVFSSDCAV